MSHRYRHYPDQDQEPVLSRHCQDSRDVWNMALEQCSHARRVGQYADQAAWDRQLAEARRWSPWLAEGSSSVQQAALRDLRQAFRNWWANPAHFRRPTWRSAKKGHVGFVVRDLTVAKVNRRWAEITIPKAGRVRFRLSRPIPTEAKTARVTRDRAGRWHVSIVAVPIQIDGPESGEVVGIDRGVAVSFQASDGRAWNIPGLKVHEQRRLRLLQRKLARQQNGSNRRAKTKTAIARLRAREVDRRKDSIAASENRESQAVFRCTRCGHTANADVNAALNIAAGQVVSARGGTAQSRPPDETRTTPAAAGVSHAV